MTKNTRIELRFISFTTICQLLSVNSGCCSSGCFQVPPLFARSLGLHLRRASAAAAVDSKGISASALPYKRTPPSWLKISSQDVRAQIVIYCIDVHFCVSGMIPEDLYHLIKMAVAIRKDKDPKFRLILVESRIHRLARYYNNTKKLPPKTADGEEIQPLVCDNGTGMVKLAVRIAVSNVHTMKSFLEM
ncbi:40S ribosomal protein S13 [Linum grandiflorum]